MKIHKNRIFLLLIILCFFKPLSYSLNLDKIEKWYKKNKKTFSQVLKTGKRKLESYNFDPSTSLIERVKIIPDANLNEINKMDKRNYKPYMPSSKELKVLEQCFELLPPLNKRIIKERMVAIYFLDESFMGSGLADWLLDKEGNVYTYLVLNPKLFNMNLSEWMTWKENSCFINTDSSIKIDIECSPEYSAILGLLLHETTHITDYVSGDITPFVEPGMYFAKRENGIIIPETPFVKGTWISLYQPCKLFDYKDRDKISFYGLSNGPKISIKRAETLYKNLSKTPFVSLYASQSWSEDLAEFVAMYHITEKLNQNYKISVLKNSKAVFTMYPMKNKDLSEKIMQIEEKFYKI